MSFWSGFGFGLGLGCGLSFIILVVIFFALKVVEKMIQLKTDELKRTFKPSEN